LLNAHYTKLESYLDELHSLNLNPFRECGCVKNFTQYQHKEHICQFSKNLHNSYSNVRSHILM